jgi:hypothetical protein
VRRLRARMNVLENVLAVVLVRAASTKRGLFSE